MSIVHHLHILMSVAVSLPGELWIAPLLALSLAAAALSGVVPPRRVAGPDRIAPSRPAWPLLGVMFGALGVYLFSASLYETITHPHAAPTATTQPQDRPAIETAFVSTVPPLLGFLALVLGSHLSREVSDQDLGLGLGRLRQGAARGSIGVVIVVPPLFVVAQLVEVIYRHVHYRHPTEHPFLHTLGEKPGAGVVAAIIIGACVIAPLFEELLFRGYLQTLIRRMLYRLSTRALPPAGFTVISPANDTAFAPQVEPSPPSAPQTWAAIVVTSAIFASVHPAWSQPVIFVLALCLGYAYERTANLWVPITIHAGFNTLSTAVFLLSLYGR
jgi:hypothetical protein